MFIARVHTLYNPVSENLNVATVGIWKVEYLNFDVDLDNGNIDLIDLGKSPFFKNLISKLR